jgi:predicted nucleotidyltransferase component of viral defense system
VKAPRNISASVRARLTSHAKARHANVQLVLLRYAIERLLYRLSRSEYADRFILKGAMLFNLWADAPYRATGDLDLLGYGDSAADRLVEIFQAVCATDVEPDGIEFLADTVRAEQARENEEYQGVRVTLEARIAGARLSVQVDIGFGDVIVPEAQSVEYPALLEFPAPRLRAYPRETVVAEKFQALVRFGALTSRMKDFYDLWAIATIFDFRGPVLAEAIRATFERRQTKLPLETPDALTAEFVENPTKQAQWHGFLQRTAIAMAPKPLPVVLAKIREFVMPPTTATGKGVTFEETWPPGGPWRAR